MDTVVADRPNLTPETVPVQKVDSGLEAIAQKMTAMKESTLRNQMKATEAVEAGSKSPAGDNAPVAPEGVKVGDNDVADNDTDLVEPKIADPEAEYSQSNDEADAPNEVSQADSTPSDIIDFLEFAEENPNAKFRFKRNGQEIEIDAKKAAAILGQGAAISEDARQLKIEKAEFDDYIKNKRAETEGLLLAMEFTVRPQLQKAYDEIVKTQEYQTVFQQQLAQTSDPVARTRIQANMQQNERYIAQQGQLINQLKPNIDQFYNMRSQQVKEVIEASRNAFKDKDLRNDYIYNEIREKVSKGWTAAEGQLVPGIKNIDLISSDEHLLSLIRDGLRYRDRPKTKSAGSSIAALTNRKGTSSIPSGRGGDEITNLQEKAKAGDRNAQNNLLLAKMNAMRASRGARR